MTVAVGLVVVAPAVLPDPEDDFPISTYPMFTIERGEVVDLDTAVLVDHDGRHRLSPQVVGGTSEPVSASVAVTRAIQEGPVSLELLCQDIADRVDEPGEIQVVTERHDAVDLLQHGGEPLEVRIHERCDT